MSASWKMLVICGLMFLGMTGEGLAQPALEDIRSDKFIRQTLENGEPEQVLQLLVDLGVSEDAATEYQGLGREPSEERFAWLELRPIEGAEARVLFLPCAPIAQASAILLTLRGSKWRTRDVIGLDCHYDDRVSLQTLYLTSAKQLDLIVRHDCVAHGTGYLEQHLGVYRFASGKMRKALDETDLIVDYNPPISKRQTSVFLPTEFGVLEETRETLKFTPDDEPIPSSLRVERRTFRWSAALNKFQSSPFRRLR